MWLGRGDSCLRRNDGLGRASLIDWFDFNKLPTNEVLSSEQGSNKKVIRKEI